MKYTKENTNLTNSILVIRDSITKKIIHQIIFLEIISFDSKGLYCEKVFDIMRNSFSTVDETYDEKMWDYKFIEKSLRNTDKFIGFDVGSQKLEYCIMKND